MKKLADQKPTLVAPNILANVAKIRIMKHLFDKVNYNKFLTSTIFTFNLSLKLSSCIPK